MADGMRARDQWRYRSVIVLAMVVVSCVAVGLIVARSSSEAVEVIPGQPPGAPAQPGPVGSWVLTHTVDLPPGLQIVEQRIEATSSTTELAGLPPESPGYCSVTVTQRQSPVRPPTGGQPVTIGSAPGVYLSESQRDPDVGHGVFWDGPTGDHAHAFCHGGRTPTLALARRVRFAATPVKVPLRLEDVPTGYQPGSITLRPNESSPQVRLTLAPRAQTGVGIVIFQLATLPPVGTRGERVEIAGRRGVLHARPRQACLQDVAVVCAGEAGDDSVGNSAEWPPGARQRVISTVQHVRIAPHPSDAESWFEGRRAFPN